jgi:hypothetical protein
VSGAAALNGSTQRALLHEANLLIGYHEQRLVIQPIFDTIDSELGAALLRLEDPLGTYKLLPHGGNWADLSTRMGMVAAGDGPAPRFALPPLEDGEKLEGTIGEYFTIRIRENSVTRLQLMHRAPPRIERFETLPYPEDIEKALRQTQVRARRFEAFLQQLGSNLENEFKAPGGREFLDRVTDVLE